MVKEEDFEKIFENRISGALSEEKNNRYENGIELYYKALISLMKDLDKEISNAIRVRNCLLLLVNLCFNPESPDFSYNKGKSPRELSKDETFEMHELLRCEFNN